MKGKPQVLDTPNCMVFQEIKKAPDEIRDVPEEEAEEAAVQVVKKHNATRIRDN